MRRVAGKAGITAPAIYHHFESKAALIDAVVADGFATFEEFLQRGAGNGASLADLTVVCRQYREFAIAHPRLYEVLFLRRRDDARRFPGDFDGGTSRSFDIVREEVRVCMASGVLKPGDATAVAFTLWAHGHGLVSLWWVGRFGNDVDAFRIRFDDSLQMLFQGLAA